VRSEYHSTLILQSKRPEQSRPSQEGRGGGGGGGKHVIQHSFIGYDKRKKLGQRAGIDRIPRLVEGKE